MTRAATASLVLTGLLCGCGDPAGTNSGPEFTVAIPIEADWRSQVADVRAGRTDEIRVTDRPITSEEFHDLADGCEGLAVLVLDQADPSSDDVAILPSLPKLRWLKLPAAIDDEAARDIARCRGLDTLNLPAAVVSDAGLAELASLDRLSLLRIGSPNVTDAGLKPLSASTTLRFLHLVDVPITDEGLAHVAAIESLESFYLDGGRTTDAGLAKLLADRPDLHFHKDQGHLPGDPNADHHD